MWRSKKFIIIAVLVAVVAVGSTVGVVLAQDNSGGTTQSQTIWQRAAAILGTDGVNVTADQLQSALTQARKDQQSEAIDARIQAAVDSVKITQAQADAIKAWLAQRPDMSAAQQQIQTWLQSRPQIPGGVLGAGRTMGGMMRGGGMMGRIFGR